MIKNTFETIAIAVSIAVSVSANAQSWTTKADLPGVNTYRAGFSIGSKGYVYEPGKTANIYDPATDAWSNTSQCTDCIYSTVRVVTIGNKGYVLQYKGGVNSPFCEYDPSSDTWAKKADFPIGLSALDIAAQSFFELNGEAYLIGGANLNRVWKYTQSTDTWTQLGDFPISYGNFSLAFSINGKGYAYVQPITGTPSFWEYTQATDTWVSKATPNLSGNTMVGFAIGSYGFIGCGYNSSGFLNKFNRFDPISDTWTVSDSIPSTDDVKNAASFVIGNKAYITGGQGRDYMTFPRTTWEYNSGITTGINEVNQNNITTIYPNPANGILNIEVKETANIKIVNMLGATVATQKLNAGNNSIDVSTLTKGIYFVQSSNGGAVKFIKE